MNPQLAQSSPKTATWDLSRTYATPNKNYNLTQFLMNEVKGVVSCTRRRWKEELV